MPKEKLANLLAELIAETKNSSQPPESEQKYDGMLTAPLRSVLGEFQKGYIYCIAGRPAIGKTTLVKKIIKDEKDKQFAVFSTETKKEDFFRGLEECRNLTVYDGVVRMDEMESILNQSSCDIAVIDTIQMIWDSGNDEASVFSSILMKIRQLARSKEIPIIIVSQVGRDCEYRPNHRPRLRDLDYRHYGGIPQIADCVVFIYNQGYYDMDKSPTEELIIAKNRGKDTGTVFLNYKDNQQFRKWD